MKKAFIRCEVNGIETRSDLMDLDKARVNVAIANADQKIQGFYWFEEIKFGPWIQGEIVFNVKDAIVFEENVHKIDFPKDYYLRQSEYLKAVSIGTDILIQNMMSWKIKDDPDFN